jgi:hypothetical protein
MFRRVVAFDDRMAGGVKMLGRMFVGRGIAASDMAAGTAEPEMNPAAPHLQTFLAAARAGFHFVNAIEMAAIIAHRKFLT